MLAQPHRGRRRPLAVTDNLNFGNPEKPEIMGQLVGCIRGIAEACRALDFPVVSGNVSLYNETNGRAILPTPAIGGVGLLDDFTQSATLAFKCAGEAILLVGETTAGSASRSTSARSAGREEGAPPPVDLDRGEGQRRLRARPDPRRHRDRRARPLRRRPPGGAGRDGDGLRAWRQPRGRAQGHPRLAHWFGEDQARYVVTVPAATREAVLAAARRRDPGVADRANRGRRTLTIPGERPILVKALPERFEGWFPAYMAGELPDA